MKSISWYFMGIWAVFLIALAVAASNKDDVCIYQSRTDKDKSVVSYIRGDGKVFRLTVNTDELETKYDVIEKWILERKSDK